MRLSNEAVTSCKAMAVVMLCGAIVPFAAAAAARCRDMLHQLPACSEKASACSGVCTALCTYVNICPRFLQPPEAARATLQSHVRGAVTVLYETADDLAGSVSTISGYGYSDHPKSRSTTCAYLYIPPAHA